MRPSVNPYGIDHASTELYVRWPSHGKPVRPRICTEEKDISITTHGARWIPTRSSICVLLLVALTAIDAAAQRGAGEAAGGGWDVTKARGKTREIDFTTSEGTRNAVDISPDGTWIVFDLLGHILGQIQFDFDFNFNFNFRGLGDRGGSEAHLFEVEIEVEIERSWQFPSAEATAPHRPPALTPAL